MTSSTPNLGFQEEDVTEDIGFTEEPTTDIGTDNTTTVNQQAVSYTHLTLPTKA